MNTPMEPPIRMLDTERVAPDTYVVRQLGGEGMAPVAVHINSMVITGAEPVVVDCGPAITRTAWLDRTFELVDPVDVRWIYLSHDDTDHTGNLHQVLDACPNATLVTTSFMAERMSAEGMLPMERLRWVNDGESFWAGDRELVAVVPPSFDSPTTRGLYDSSTGVYWAADSFGNPVTHEVSDVRELDPGFYRQAFVDMQRMLSPWHQWLDPVKYQAHLDRIASLGARVVASVHGTTLRDGQIASALELFRELPHLPAIEQPGQVDLEEMIATIAAMAPADDPVTSPGPVTAVEVVTEEVAA